MDLKGKSLLILAILVFLIGAVSAEELNDSVAIDNGDLSQSDTLETISVDENVEINTSTGNNFEVFETNNEDNESSDISSVATEWIPENQTFAAIQTAIDSASDGDIIKLSGNYTGSGTQITVNKNLNFVGENQAVLDAKTLTRLIYINADYTVTFTNIKFMNGKLTNNVGGGIYVSGGNIKFYNCNFTTNTLIGSNTKQGNGGAVYIYDGSVNFTNCNFISNAAVNIGGAVFARSGSENFTNCNFISNAADNSGGAVYTTGDSVNFTNCNFISNAADESGGICNVNGYYIDFTNCNFINNSASSGCCGIGGNGYVNANIISCNFTGNHGGSAVITFTAPLFNISDCNFINNSASSADGGAIATYNLVSVSDCNFINNTCRGCGGAIRAQQGGNITNCNFINNSANANTGSSVMFDNGYSNVKNCYFQDSLTNKKGVVATNSNNCQIELNNNSFSTNSLPYIIYGTVLSPVELVTLNNTTVYSFPNQAVDITASLFDDNGNKIWLYYLNSVTVTIEGLTTLNIYWDNNKLEYWTSYIPNVAGVYIVNGTMDTTYVKNITYKNGTLNTYITDLTLNITVNSTNPYYDDTVELIIAVENKGPVNATNVNVTEILGEKLEYISHTNSTGTYNPETGIWDIGELNINEKATLTITARVKYTGNITNSITLNALQIPSSITKSIEINSVKKTLTDTDIKTEIINSSYGNATVKVIVPTSATGDITIKINGKDYNGTINDGVAIIKLDDVPVGKHEMNITYDGDENYNSLTVFDNITIKKDLNPGDITAELTNQSYGNTTVKVTVPVDATGNVTIKVNNQNYTGIIDNGVATVKLSNLTVGKYTAEITYNGDETYNSISTTLDIEVVKGNINDSSIKTEVLNKTYGNTTLKVTVPENVTGNITINVNGKDYNGTIDNGSAIIKLPDVPAGNHTMTITYNGDENYNSKTITEDLEVIKVEINPDDMKIKIINNTYGNTCVNVTVPINATGKVTINVNGQNYTGIINNGIATVDLGNVTAGNHTMNIIYNGDNNYNSISKEDDLEVVKANITNLTTIVLNNTYGNVTIQVNVPENVTGSITINVNGENHTETIDNGSVTIKIPDIAIGDYKMNVTYKGNENYNSLTTQEDLKVRLNLKPEQVTTDIINDTYGNVKIQINVPYNVTGNVTIKVGNKTFNANISNGVAIVNLTGVEAGNHTLDMNVTYNGDDNYNPLTKTESLEVKKANITMNIETLNNTYGNTTVKITVPDDVTGDVLIKVGNETYKGIIANGSATVKLNNVTAGNHTMTITYPGDNNYNSYTTEEKLEVFKAEINPDDMKVEIISNITDKVEVRVTVPENATGNITIKIGNDTYIAPIANGSATINITNITEGNYTMNVTYPGDDNFEPISKDVNLTVEPSPLVAIEMPIKAINITYGELETITVILPDNATGIVIFNVNGTEYPPIIIEDTNLQGIGLDKQVKLDLNDLGAGIYNVTATYSGDSYYASIANSTTFKVVKAEINPDDIKVDIINNTAGNVTLNITVPEGVEGNITINVGNKTYNGTIENGSAIIKLPDVPVGNNTVEVVYNGDDNHDPIAKTENITVGKHILSPDNITTEVLNNTYGNTTIKVNVPENVTGNVTITVNNKTYNGTIANGSAIVKLLDVPAGNHTITVTYNGDENYEPIAKQEQLEIVKNTLNSGDINVTIINNTYGNTTVKIDLPEDATGNITLTINNESFTVPIANGSAIIKLPNVPAGNHTMNITYSGDNNYNSTTIEKELTIEKTTINPDDIQIIVDEDDEGNTVITIIAPPNFNDNITLEIGGKNYTVEVINGTGSLTIPKLPAGKYDIIIKFDGNDNFNGFTKYLTIEIESDNTKENNTSIAGEEKTNNTTEISSPDSLENIKTANPILLLLLILLAIPLRRRKEE